MLQREIAGEVTKNPPKTRVFEVKKGLSNILSISTRKNRTYRNIK
jgi:hypothetical protein